MEAALGWIGQLFDWIVQFLPRVTWVPPTHGAIAFTRGKHVRTYGPGLAGRWYCPMWWPAWTDMTLYPLVRQTHTMEAQTLTTSDGVEIVVAGMIIYQISDLEKALTIQYDLEDTITDISAAAMAKFVRTSSYGAVGAEDGETLKTTICEPLQEYGVDVTEAWITDFAKTTHYTVAGVNITVESE